MPVWKGCGAPNVPRIQSKLKTGRPSLAAIWYCLRQAAALHRSLPPTSSRLTSPAAVFTSALPPTVYGTVSELAVLPARVRQSAYDGLHKALSKDRSDRWFELETIDSKVAIDLSQVVYVRIDTEEQRVGF